MNTLLNSKGFLKTHAGGIILALLIGAVVAAPPIVWHFSSGYQGIEMMKTNTELHYIAQVQEVYDGYGSLGNPYLADGKNMPYLFPPFSPHLIAVFGKLLHVEAVTAVLLWRFIIVSILAFLVYLFSQKISDSRMAGMLASVFVILGYGVVVPGQFLEFMRGGNWLPEPSFIDYGRPINPQVSSALFFAYGCLLWWILTTDGRRKMKITLGGILLGSAFYTYLFTWTFAICLSATLIVVLFVCKERERANTLFFAIGLGVLFGIPYLLHSWGVSHHPLYAEVATRFGFVERNTFEISRLVIGGIVLLGISWKLWNRMERIFFGGAFVTALVIVNEHILTGMYLFNHHYHWYYATPITIIFLSVLVVRVLHRFTVVLMFQRILIASLILFFLAGGVTAQVQSYQGAISATLKDQSYAPFFAWAKNLPAGKTFFAPIPLADMIPALTSHNSYFTSTALYTLTSNDRLAHAYLGYVYLEGVPAKDARTFIERDESRISNLVFGYRCSFLDYPVEQCVPEGFLEKLVERYIIITDKNFVAFLSTYPVDYLVYDTRQNPSWKPQAFGLKISWQEQGITVYEVPEKQ